ncbi:hypothetical protein [Marinobacter sp. X15-166B]|uniref:hypothetical protein n=1 Tax=Marinobacter sp. X15-166B TaxID=1897620 RepID=UPI00085BB44A|nr:hypothetical protein [Marinobacter sp. X15-166B]OEY65112.1 hypothetical protein BG841_00615 [Marinobacter sp. X15-166B]
MEPIRPDDEDLRAVPANKPTAGVQKKPRVTKESRPDASVKPAARGSKGTAIVYFLLVVLAVALAGVWLEQGRRISVLEGQLEEADYWARQSKLALARFESTLSQTGESLQETGSTMAEKLAQQQADLKTANSEIRKLWVVANERNKKRLDEQLAQLQTLQAELQTQRSDLLAWGETLNTMKAGFSQQLTALEQADAAAREQVLSLQQSVAGVDDQISKRLARFEQEQQLGRAEIASRLQAVEKNSSEVASRAALAKAQRQLAELQNTVKSIDASRAQLTSRLVRLSAEVDALKAR